MYKIKFDTSPMKLVENEQLINMKFAAIDIDGETITTRHTFIKCKDYWNEIVVGSHKKFMYGCIYGFYLDTAKFPINLEQTEILLAVTGPVNCAVREHWYLLNQIEEENGFEPSSFLSIEQDGLNYILVVGDKRWMENSMYISLYTTLLRILGQNVSAEGIETLEDYLKEVSLHGKGDDTMYIKAYLNQKVSIATLLEYQDRIVKDCNRVGVADEYPEDSVPVRTLHNQGGFQAFLTHMRTRVSEGDVSRRHELASKGIECEPNQGLADNYYQLMKEIDGEIK